MSLSDEQFSVSSGYFCPALSKAVKTMKKGEKVLLTVKPQCESIGVLFSTDFDDPGNGFADISYFCDL